MDLTAGIVRILGPNHETVGTGFLVSDAGLAITCAHVVLDAGSGPGDIVLVVLHRTGEERNAVVEPAWWRDPDAEDVAFLRVRGPLPAEVERLPLGSSSETADHPFKSFGFPAAKPVDGMWGYGILGDATMEKGCQVRQLTSKEVTRGFSGAPVLDKISRRVVGMVADMTLLDRYRRLAETSFFIPSETLLAVCRDLGLADPRPHQTPGASSVANAGFGFERDVAGVDLVAPLKSGRERRGKKRTSVDSIPERIPQAVQDALRNWRGRKHPLSLWSEMLIVAQQLDKQSIPDLGLAVQEILLEALDTLNERTGSAMGQILRLHFLEGTKVSDIANRLSISADSVYRLQRAAIQELAGIVWQSERNARSAKAARVAQRLEIHKPARLFGVDDKLAELVTGLTAEGPPWLIALVGIGGIGKTSLADALVREVAHSPVFVDVAWVSARQEHFTSWSGLFESSKENPALTLEGLADAIIEQLDFHDLARLPLAQKQAGLSARFKAQPYLTIVDNLETAADYRALVPSLERMIGPSKLLLTSRHSLHEYSSVHTLRLNELSAQDSLALVRHEASSRGLAEVATASDENLMLLYEVAGGNPLALKLLVGQMHTLSLARVVEGLRQARGRTIEELYRFIYWQSWHLLSTNDRQVLAIIPLISESSGGLEHVATLSKLEDEPLTEALERLVTLCLIDVHGPLEARRYSIHRLTETFLVNEVIKWQRMS